jgi:hypothetical protein
LLTWCKDEGEEHEEDDEDEDEEAEEEEGEDGEEGEESEEEVAVSKFHVGGVEYYKDGTGVLYDVTTQDEVGYWSEELQLVMEICKYSTDRAGGGEYYRDAETEVLYDMETKERLGYWSKDLSMVVEEREYDGSSCEEEELEEEEEEEPEVVFQHSRLQSAPFPGGGGSRQARSVPEQQGLRVAPRAHEAGVRTAEAMGANKPEEECGVVESACQRRCTFARR